MRKGIGPNSLGAPKGVGKMYKATPAKLDTDPPKSKAGMVTRIDANMSNRAQKSSRKPAAEQGSMQDFVNQGPVPFIKRGYKKVANALSELDDYIGGQTQKEATKDLNNRRYNSPAKKGRPGPSIGSKKSERLMEKSERIAARAYKNTVPSTIMEGDREMNTRKYTKKGMRLSKRSDRIQFHAMGMSRADARRVTNEMRGK